MDDGSHLAASRNLAPGPGMNAEQWQRLKAVLDAVLPLQGEERAAYLDEVFLGDPSLRSELESLLCSHEQATSNFLRDPAVAVLAPLFVPPAAVQSGRRIGAYQILGEIGRGGMGEVYRAVRADGAFDRQVAIKMVRGGFDTYFIGERFRNERQILAGLDHPNIARLLDGGATDDGIPYIVMELVEGTPIDAHCDQHSLNIARRLELFRSVCSAVHYAHQHLVIHRDLKPGNILVTPDGVPKLLDFGIAKIVSPSAGVETTLMHALTPEYASPEQVRGQPVSTASDVYSLGVVLYQLLTGCSPYGGFSQSAPGLARAICEVEPQRPSTAVLRRGEKPEGSAASDLACATREGSIQKWQRRLRGDLDNIVLKAMRKEPERRYASAEQFGEDIRRHLQGLPVIARQDSWSYRAGKFVRRHKAIVAATVVVILTLAVGMTITLHEKRIAERRFHDVRKLANSLIFEIDSSIADVPGSTAARKLLVGRALEYLDSLSREASGDPSLQTELATAYERVGDVLGYPYAPNLGDHVGALESYHKALLIRESLPTSLASDPKLQAQLSGTYFRIANVLELTGDLNGALASLRKTLPITEKLAAGNSNPELADHFGGSHYFIAGLLVKTGDMSGALENYRQAASIREASLQSNPSSVPLRTHLAADYAGMATCMRSSGELVQATAMQTKSIEILRQLSRVVPNSASMQEYLGEALTRLGHLQLDQGKLAESLASQHEAHAIFQGLLAADSSNSLARSNFAFTDNAIAEVLVRSGQPTRAITPLLESLATFRSMSPETSSNRYTRSGMASAYSGMGDVYSALASSRRLSATAAALTWREARSWYERSLALWSDKRQRGELESEERSEQQNVLGRIARCEAALHGKGSHAAH
jgi:non-specific serine/threonine protein kinase/serine/threonine-protein kinase